MSDTEINATINVTEDVLANVDATAMSAAVIDDGDSIVVPAEVDMGDTFDTELEDENLIDVPIDESVGIQGDHRLLLHRDAANQHPMSAITGLDDAIAGINTALSSRISQVEAETADLDSDMASALLRIGDLQDQVDGNITTWFYAAEPAMNLPPVALDPSNPHDTGWDTIDKKNAHRGDLYYNTLTGYAYRFAYADGDYGWMRITDTDVVKALADAAKAQDTADSKRRVFYTTPYPPYDKGDLWVQGAGGDILVCNTSKAAGETYDYADWARASKYTDDYVANIALASANGKNTVYHQPSQPTGGTYKKGDTWFDTDDDYTMYTYDGALWVKEQFGNEAIKDLSITNAKIANATIEYGKIKSVDAGKITVGDLAAARIKTHLIEAFQLVVSDLKALAATIGGFFIGDTDIHTKDVDITSNADNSVGLSSSTFTRTINGTSRSNLKFAIGSKFGVAKDGTLYSAGLDSVSSSVQTLDGRVTTNESNISANADEIALRAKSSEVYTKGQVYTKTETDSAITQKADEITQSVSQTYQTKDAMSGYYTKTQTDSAITQKAGEISLSVAQEEISKVVEGLSVDMTVSGSNLIFRAKLIQGGEDVTNTIPDGDFEWFYRTPSGDVPMNLNGKSITIAQSSQEYGRTVVCVWSRNQYAYLLTNNGNKLRISTGDYLLGRTEY